MQRISVAPNVEFNSCKFNGVDGFRNYATSVQKIPCLLVLPVVSTKVLPVNGTAASNSLTVLFPNPPCPY